MIFEGFKRANVIKRVNRCLKEKGFDNRAKNGKIKSVLLFFEESINQDVIKVVSTGLNVSRAEVCVLLFKKKDSVDAAYDNCVTLKDFDLFGNLKNVEVKELLNEKTDLLINYVRENHFLNSLVVESNALFKIGMSEDNKMIYDLMIDVSEDDADDYNNEMKKYLKILNKI